MSTQPHDEALHPRESTGKFRAKPVADASGGMDALATPAPDWVKVAIPATRAEVHVRGLEQMPPWPAELDTPEASYSWTEHGNLELTLESQGQCVIFYGDAGDTYNDLDEVDPASAFAQHEDAITVYGNTLRSNLRDVTEQVRSATDTPEMSATIVTLASGAQPAAPAPSGLAGRADELANAAYQARFADWEGDGDEDEDDDERKVQLREQTTYWEGVAAAIRAMENGTAADLFTAARA